MRLNYQINGLITHLVAPVMIAARHSQSRWACDAKLHGTTKFLRRTAKCGLHQGLSSP